MNPLKRLSEAGQSVWLDFLSRELMDSGRLERLIREDGVSGLTSNPTIFQAAISKGEGYDEDLRASRGASAEQAFEELAVSDVRRACDLFLPVHRAAGGRDGFVSLEVSPLLADDAQATVEEARRLWSKVDRPNLLVKVPGTQAGLPAIRRLIGEGVSVNVTLLFSVRRYEEVHEAYLGGLEDLAARGGELSRVASVASFFVSRVDTLLDSLLRERLAAARQESEKAVFKGLLGTVAVANAKAAYRSFRIARNGARFRALAAAGAAPQRVLFASTSTKNPDYRDVVYVEELIGPDTVNTMPLETLDAFRGHGRVRPSLAEGEDEARRRLDKLANYQLDLEELAAGLERDGVRKFEASYRDLLEVIERKRRVLA